MFTTPMRSAFHATLWACALAALLGISTVAVTHAQADGWIDAYREPASRLIGAAVADRFAWNRLAELTDTFGPVMVPRWVRGRESLEVVTPFPRPLVMLGLGGSVGTPPEGIEAEVLVVSSFDELERQAAEARGRIVVFDVPYTTYGETVRYRSSGASRAASVGAVAMLLR
jgi:carboxypeptidase Q